MATNILDAELGEYAGMGFRLVECDDHITELYFKEKLIAYFQQTSMTVERLRWNCKKYLNGLNGGEK